MDDKNFKLPILIFDSECSLCIRFKDSLKRLPNTEYINPVSIHEDAIYKAFPLLNKEECESEVHYITEEGNILHGSEVMEHLINLFPMVNKFSWLIESKMGKKAIDYFHNMTNKYRRTLIKKCGSCTS